MNFKNPTLEAIVAEYNHVKNFIPRSNFISDRDHEDAMAVGLYTDESFVYWLMNAWANDTSAERERGLRYIGPFMRRLVEALPRCCARYSGPAVRVLKAGEGSWQSLSDAFVDYERQFVAGTVLHFCGFVRFARGSTLHDNGGSVQSASIVMFCRDVEGFDVDTYSMVRLTRRHSEMEVLCLPRSAFRVSCPPSRAEWVVSVYTDMEAAPQDHVALSASHQDVNATLTWFVTLVARGKRT